MSESGGLSDTGSITALLKRIDAGDVAAKEELFQAIYTDLKRIAHRRLERSPDRDLLQTTALVNEACLRLTKDGFAVAARDRTQLFAAATRAIQWVLVDYARKRLADKRQADEGRLIREAIQRYERMANAPYLDLYEALQKLRQNNERVADVVEARFFGGLTISETAEILGVSVDTVKRSWRFGRAFLYVSLQTSECSE